MRLWRRTRTSCSCICFSLKNWIARARHGLRRHTTSHSWKRLRVSALRIVRAADKVIAIVLRMADCQFRSSQTELSAKSYHLAEKLAAQTGQGKLESVADVNDAALQTKTGKLDEALLLYQNALQLDHSLGDNGDSAQDWLAYGRFLDDAGFPVRLAYACIVKSETMTQSLPNPAVAN